MLLFFITDLCFRLLVEQNKIFEGSTLGTGKFLVGVSMLFIFIFNYYLIIRGLIENNQQIGQ